MELIAKAIMTEDGQDVEDINFDISLIIDRDNKLVVIDNRATDVHDMIDCNTLVVKQVKISI
jgi:hypothetical protein